MPLIQDEPVWRAAEEIPLSLSASRRRGRRPLLRGLDSSTLGPYVAGGDCLPGRGHAVRTTSLRVAKRQTARSGVSTGLPQARSEIPRTRLHAWWPDGIQLLRNRRDRRRPVLVRRNAECSPRPLGDVSGGVAILCCEAGLRDTPLRVVAHLGCDTVRWLRLLRPSWTVTPRARSAATSHSPAHAGRP